MTDTAENNDKTMLRWMRVEIIAHGLLKMFFGFWIGFFVACDQWVSAACISALLCLYLNERRLMSQHFP